MRTKLLFLLIATTVASGPASANVINGGFEQPDLGFHPVAAGATYGNWTNAGPGDIEFVHAEPHPSLFNLEFSAYEGSYWIDLVGIGAPSAIYQDIITIPGAQYEVTFAFSGNVWGPPMLMQMDTLWNGAITGSYSHLAQGSDGANMGWTVYTFDVVGTGIDRLMFQATSGGAARGPAIDGVSIQLVPAPGAAALLGIVAIASNRRRRSH